MQNDQIAMFGARRVGKGHGRSISAHPGTRLKYVVDPPCGEDGRKALLLAEAAYRSLHGGRRVGVVKV
jgi:hypothetical protein